MAIHSTVSSGKCSLVILVGGTLYLCLHLNIALELPTREAVRRWLVLDRYVFILYTIRAPCLLFHSWEAHVCFVIHTFSHFPAREWHQPCQIWTKCVHKRASLRLGNITIWRRIELWRRWWQRCSVILEIILASAVLGEGASEWNSWHMWWCWRSSLE